MTVTELSQTMTYEEMQKWFKYFDVRPVDWRNDDRAFKLLQAQGVKEKSWTVFPSLAPIYNATNKATKDSFLSASNLKSSVMFSKMLGAIGGDKLEAFDE